MAAQRRTRARGGEVRGGEGGPTWRGRGFSGAGGTFIEGGVWVGPGGEKGPTKAGAGAGLAAPILARARGWSRPTTCPAGGGKPGPSRAR